MLFKNSTARLDLINRLPIQHLISEQVRKSYPTVKGANFFILRFLNTETFNCYCLDAYPMVLFIAILFLFAAGVYGSNFCLKK